MNDKPSLQHLIRDAGVHPIRERQPCLPAPVQPAIMASAEDDALARQLLVEQRVNDPDYRGPSKQFTRIFKSSKGKERLQDTNQCVFSQDELDRALTAVIDKPATHSGLVQAFLNLGASVNFIETADKKSKTNRKAVVAERRRSTVIQRAATVRRADSLSLLAAAGADQTALDEALKAALAANNYPCVQELLRHGADLNRCPDALADAIRSNDQNSIRLLLRAPKALRPDIISSCLPAAVQQTSEPIISLLIGHGADPNFNSASALTTAISRREYRLTVALLAGTIPLTPSSLRAAFETAMRISSAQDLHQFLRLLFCCGLSPLNPTLGRLLAAASQRNDLRLAEMLIGYGVPTSVNEAECLRNAILKSNWQLADVILNTPVSPTHASVALDAVPFEVPKSVRLHIISGLVSKGANGRPLERWLVRAVEDGDSNLMDLLLNAGIPLSPSNNSAIQAAIARKDTRSLQSLLTSRPSPESLSQVFPLFRSGYTAAERLKTVRLLLEHGARGPEVDETLIDAIADTSSSRDLGLITELIGHGAHVDHNGGKALKLAVAQGDMPTLHLLCSANPSIKSTSAALPFIFDTNGGKRPTTSSMLELLVAGGVEEATAAQTLENAIKGGSSNIDIIERLIAADARLLGHAFQCAVLLTNVAQKRNILKVLLTKGISQESLDQALATAIRNFLSVNETSVIGLFLEYGASINYNGGDAFIQSVATGNRCLVKMVLGGRDSPSQHSITTAFRSLFDDFNLRRLGSNSGHTVSRAKTVDETDAESPEDKHSTPRRIRCNGCIDIAEELLALGVDQDAIDMALRAVLAPENGIDDVGPVVDLLLKHHADVNAANGACFVFAARRHLKIFQSLLARQPNFSTLMPSLLSCGLNEGTLVQLMEASLSHGCTADDLDLCHPPSLVLAIQKYPRSEALIKMLFTHGCNADASVSGVVDPAVGEESISAILWALAQPQKLVSSSVIIALLQAGASSIRVAPISEIAPITLAAREGRPDIVKALLQHGADASIRDKWDRSALFYASSCSISSIVESLAPHALKNDGSLHEASRSLQLDAVSLLIKAGHDPNFPSRLHAGRNALGEFCMNADMVNSSQRLKARRLLRLLLDNGARPKFKARNERSAVILALDNPYDPLKITEVLLETEVWEQLNDEKHMFRDAKGLWYSPLSYVELMPSPARAAQKQALLDLLRDKACEPKHYSETPYQPPNATNLPPDIARLAARQKEHLLTIALEKEAAEHTRALEETAHADALRRKKEQHDASIAAASASAAHMQALDQRRHDFDMQRVREAERMKRAEKAAWHALLAQQEHESAVQMAQIEERKASAAYAAENRMLEAKKAEVEHRAGVERRALKEKEESMGRNVKMQMQIQERVDESARLHAGLRQERKAVEWGTVD